MKKLKNSKYVICVMTLFVLKMNVVSADVSFNQGQATSDVNNLVAPILAFLFAIATVITGASIGFAYAEWNGKEDEEKNQMPFYKIVKRHVAAFVFLGLSTAILAWFSIS